MLVLVNEDLLCTRSNIMYFDVTGSKRLFIDSMTYTQAVQLREMVLEDTGNKTSLVFDDYMSALKCQVSGDLYSVLSRLFYKLPDPVRYLVPYVTLANLDSDDRTEEYLIGVLHVISSTWDPVGMYKKFREDKNTFLTPLSGGSVRGEYLIEWESFKSGCLSMSALLGNVEESKKMPIYVMGSPSDLSSIIRDTVKVTMTHNGHSDTHLTEPKESTVTEPKEPKEEENTEVEEKETIVDKLDLDASLFDSLLEGGEQ